MDLKQLIFIKFKQVLPISGGFGGDVDPIVLHHSAAFPDHAALEGEILNALGELFGFNYQRIDHAVDQCGEQLIERVYVNCRCRFTFHQFPAVYSFELTEYPTHGGVNRNVI